MLTPIDPHSPVPVFHQIAEGVRYRLAVGELAPGDPLPAIRDAADRLGVHYHTVRRAYAELEAEGFVRSERGRGTWIRGPGAAASRRGAENARVEVAPEAPAGLLRFLERVEMEARLSHDLGTEALGRLILARVQSEAGALHVVECNGPQARDYAEQIRVATGAETRAWLLSEGEPPAGPVVAPYFHLRDVRARWPDRAESVRYLTAELGPDLEARLTPLLAEGVRRVVVHDPRADRVHHVMEDVRQRLVGSELEVAAGGLADP
ncbi:MAG: GntR family transcriptional regulator, partial [Gemmatimonadetes bacterium]|nr:GntR family transcriptional regulator [Gemmatimonadota bacterium]NIQ52817.1 GntR family transcriptional regulator [Gemmatimonadota bacterium]NIU72947.1 GntR family transcriptional regulator [Gammaproteobacteria bacterium]NIX43302.1 GntR family transcriptional regulator [Gemmatimonadota bacterium]NIY07472.1 GntR family transcriptional regulator [Gemmatimonadota bacterium]